MESTLNVWKADFPILSREIYGKPLIYLDNAATTQKPRCVVEAIADEYYNVNANVHRGVHYLSQQATDLHEASRETVRGFINARKIEEIIFTRGTTESINLVAASFCDAFMTAGNVIITTDMEHHSNIVPWQLQAQKKGLKIEHVPFNDNGELDIEALKNILETLPNNAGDIRKPSALLTVAHVSNVLGTVNPVKEICAMAHSYGIPVLVDGAQSAPHFKVDVQDMDCDFFAFSGHKMYGPTGVGVLYGKEEWLEKLPPYQGGGEMIDKVTWTKTTFERLPFKFEAGTPDYVATHALAVAINYLQAIGMDVVHAHEQELLRYAMQRMQEIEGMRIFGTATEKDAVISFLVASIHHLDMGTLLDRLGIAVRTGHHCAQPCMDALGISGTVRASFALYNTKEDVDALLAGIERVRRMF
ncbi:MAG: cysteine desulfurase [Bacteroidaceae bacterium]|nr:cysteine desulfurase [Bacteroidaceae bacterium]